MDLKEFVLSLNERSKLNLSIRILKEALPIWDKFSNSEKTINYTDSVVGLYHTVNKDIIQRTIELAEKCIETKLLQYFKIRNLHQEYRDPIVSLQDFDWELPEEIEYLFYSAYNIVEKLNGKNHKGFDEDDILYLAINQGISSIDLTSLYSVEHVKSILKEFK